ncbi:MAG: rhodanese-like domain-containing protein [Rhodospirillaceae bacterium]|nr:rhodanese-like domain-containing protein [Rhodospirillaceae bacterium]
MPNVSKNGYEDLLPEIDAATANSWMLSREAIMLDVREASEFDFENIPASILLPLSFLDPENFPAIRNVKIIVLCAIGKRALVAQKQLQDSGLKDLFTLSGGIDSWKKAGFETQGGKFEALDYTI